MVQICATSEACGSSVLCVVCRVCVRCSRLTDRSSARVEGSCDEGYVSKGVKLSASEGLVREVVRDVRASVVCESCEHVKARGAYGSGVSCVRAVREYGGAWLVATGVRLPVFIAGETKGYKKMYFLRSIISETLLSFM